MIHSSWDRRRARTRRAILDTAMELVAAGGLPALTMHALAGALDYTPGALYRYFDSRDALVVALQLDVLAVWADALDQALSRCAGEPPLVAVLAVGRLLRELAEAQPMRFGLVSAMLGDPSRLLTDDAAAPVVQPVLALVGRITAAIAAAVSPAGAAQRTLILVGAMQGVLQLRKLDSLAPPDLRTGPAADALVPALLRGWGAAEAEIAQAQAAVDTLVAEAPLSGGLHR